MNIQSILSEKIKQAMIAAGADEQCEALVRQSGKVQFGDYQANGIMPAAKKLGLNPREFAQSVLDKAELQDIAEKTLPKKCTWDICVQPLSVMPSYAHLNF